MRSGGVVLSCINGFMVPSFFLRLSYFWGCGSGGGEEPSGEKVLRLIQIPSDVRLLYGLMRIASSQASPNFHVGPSPIHD
jgi:hypothetical protein